MKQGIHTVWYILALNKYPHSVPGWRQHDLGTSPVNVTFFQSFGPVTPQHLSFKAKNKYKIDTLLVFDLSP